MRKLIALLALIGGSLLAQQTTKTPNVGLQVPGYGTQNYQVPLDYDLQLLDRIFGGQVTVPALHVGNMQIDSISLGQQQVTNALGFFPLDPKNNLSEVVDPVAALSNLGGIGISSYKGAYTSVGTYNKGDLVYYASTGATYVSLVANNTGNQPDTSTTQWGILAQGSSSGGTPVDPTQFTASTYTYKVPNSNVAATGAVATPVTTLLNDACEGVDAKLFGFLPIGAPGSSDTANVTAFQNAQAAAFASGQATLCIPGGTYAVSAPLTVMNKVRIVGKGRGDVGSLGGGAIGTVIQASANFPKDNTLPVMRVGLTNTGFDQFNSGVQRLGIDCNGRAGIGLQDTWGQEQTRHEHLIVLSCANAGIEVNGADSVAVQGLGASQNHGGIFDIEIFAGAAAVASTVGIRYSNVQEGDGIERVSIVNSQQHHQDWGIFASGNNFKIHSVHMEAMDQGGVILGAGGTVGAQHIQLSDIVLSTGASGSPVFIPTNTINAPVDIDVKGASGGTGCPVYDAATGAGCVWSSYHIGGQTNGSFVHLDYGFGGAWQLHNPIYNDQPFTNFNYFESKMPVAPFYGCRFYVDGSGNAVIGGPDNCQNYLFTDPYAVLSISPGNTLNGVNLQGGISDSNNGLTSLLAYNLYWSHSGQQFVSPGDGSGSFGAVANINPGGNQTPSAAGGIGIYSGAGANANQSFTQSQLNGFLRMIVPPDGGLQLLNSNSAVCRRGTIRFYADPSNQTDAFGFCGFATGSLQWLSPGGSSGGSGPSGPTYSFTSPLSVTGSTVSISQASSTTPGFLSAADWTTFNSKQNSLTFSGTGSKVATVSGTFTNGDLLVYQNGNLIDGGPVGSGGGGTTTSQSATLTFGAIPDGTCLDQTFAFAGVGTSTPLTGSYPAGLPTGVTAITFASGTNTADVRLCNLSGSAVTLSAGTFIASIGAGSGGGGGTGTTYTFSSPLAVDGANNVTLTTPLMVAAGGNGICLNSTTGVAYPCPHIRLVSGTTDTVTSTDCGNIIRYTNASQVAVVLGAPTTSIPAYCPVKLRDEGTGGLTIAPGGGLTIAGSSSNLAVSTGGTAAKPKAITLEQDGANWTVGENN